MATTVRPSTDAPARTRVFDRVLVGVDHTDASIEAARQAARARRTRRRTHAARRLLIGHVDGRRRVRVR